MIFDHVSTWSSRELLYIFKDIHPKWHNYDLGLDNGIDHLPLTMALK